MFWPGEFHGLYGPWVTKSQTRLSDFHLVVFLYPINDTYFKQKVQSMLTGKKNTVYKDKVSISTRLSYAADVGIIRQ